MENTSQDIPQKRPRGRPKTGFNQIEYNKQYRQTILKNNTELKNNVLASKKRYNTALKKSFDLIKLMFQNGDINDKYKDKLSEILV